MVASGQRERRLAPPGGRVGLDRDDPLDPPEAAAAGSDQADREAVTGAEGAAAEAGGQVQVAGVGQGEAAPVAGGRGDDQAGGGSGAFQAAGREQAVEPDTLPGGAAIPAAGAVQDRLDPVAEAGQLLVAPVAGRVS